LFFKFIQLNLGRINGQNDRRKRFNGNSRKTLENDNESRRWILKINNPTQQQIIEIRDRIIIQSIWTRVMSIRDLQNNYVVELIGVIEFNIFCSLNWVGNVISSDCEW
jgi:hypothetical protein